ncbi:MAG: hypothetical protein HC930_15310 [Hydrococcus sp. SU_1_0]|nr:hypothetical protein [Hydrococcus sp. SU_1_0]
MIPNSIKTISLDFKSPAAALEHLNSRKQQCHLIQTHNLAIDKEGLLSHRTEYKAFEGIPLTDVAVEHLNSLVKISPSYGAYIDPDLHAHSINKLLKNLNASVTVVVSSDAEKPDNKHIAAILPGASSIIDDSIILQRLEFWDLKARVHLSNQEMEVHFGNLNQLEVLPEDTVQLSGVLRNAHWGAKKLANNL